MKKTLIAALLALGLAQIGEFSVIVAQESRRLGILGADAQYLAVEGTVGALGEQRATDAKFFPPSRFHPGSLRKNHDPIPGLEPLGAPRCVAPQPSKACGAVPPRDAGAETA